MHDSFFELHIQVTSNTGDYFTQGPLNCGPYLSYIEAAEMMMNGIEIALHHHLQEIKQLEQPLVHSQIVECLIIDGTREQLNVKSEEIRYL